MLEQEDKIQQFATLKDEITKLVTAEGTDPR